MSMRVWGGLILANNVTIDETKELSFQVMKIASENRVGIKLGWNVSPNSRKEFEGRIEIIPFELVDNPLSDVAQILFSGDGVRQLEKHQRVDLGEPLESRMKRVQKLILELFDTKLIKKIVMYVNSGFGEEQLKEMKASKFVDTILELYTRGKTWEPSVKLIINY
jgi:hypothetical protein